MDATEDDASKVSKTVAEKVCEQPTANYLSTKNYIFLERIVKNNLELNFQMLDIDSPDIVVPRQSIAQGATPIAARESVIRHQMSMKEDDYTFTQTLR